MGIFSNWFRRKKKKKDDSRSFDIFLEGAITGKAVYDNYLVMHGKEISTSEFFKRIRRLWDSIYKRRF